MKDASSIDSMKVRVVQALLRTQNAELLYKVHMLLGLELEASQVLGYRPDGSVVTRGEIEDQIDQDFIRDDYLTIEELEEQSKTWS